MGTCPRRAAWSARHPVTVEAVGSNPIGGAECRTIVPIVPDQLRQLLYPWHGAPIWQSDQVQTLVGVGSIPSRATEVVICHLSFTGEDREPSPSDK